MSYLKIPTFRNRYIAMILHWSGTAGRILNIALILILLRTTTRTAVAKTYVTERGVYCSDKSQYVLQCLSCLSILCTFCYAFVRIDLAPMYPFNSLNAQQTLDQHICGSSRYDFFHEIYAKQQMLIFALYWYWCPHAKYCNEYKYWLFQCWEGHGYPIISMCHASQEGTEETAIQELLGSIFQQRIVQRVRQVCSERVIGMRSLQCWYIF